MGARYPSHMWPMMRSDDEADKSDIWDGSLLICKCRSYQNQRKTNVQNKYKFRRTLCRTLCTRTIVDNVCIASPVLPTFYDRRVNRMVVVVQWIDNKVEAAQLTCRGHQL